MMFNMPLISLIAMQLVLKAKIRSDLTPKEWVNLLTNLNMRGMLYFGFQDGKIARIAIAYRVNEINEDTDSKIPDKEEGTILWIANFISFESDKSSIRDEIRDLFLRYKDLTEIAFENPQGKIVRVQRKVINEREKENKLAVA